MLKIFTYEVQNRKPLVTWHGYHCFFSYSRIISMLGATSPTRKGQECFDLDSKKILAMTREKIICITLQFPYLFAEGRNHNGRTLIKRMFISCSVMYSISIIPSYFYNYPDPNNLLISSFLNDNYRRQKKKSEFYIKSMNYYKFATLDNPTSSIKQI